VCPARAAHVEQTIGEDVDTVADALARGAEAGAADPKHVDLRDNERLGVIYASLDLIASWAKAVRGRIEHELLQARAVPGVKLVAGRRGAPQWNEPAAAEA
ncbi:DUF2800 domain-containing protein, partial [Burkholderia cenocepacia]|uniref:DUF2800 domain-containing protein n=1 Tax=Burkholderia cenocepacia TaxID=95486 RepID=UPI00222EF7EC